MIWRPGLYSAEQVPESVYHADAFGDVPTLSRSTAAELVNDSPADAWDHHPQLGALVKRKVTREMELASLVHSLLLGSGPEFVTLPDRYADFKKNAAIAMRDHAREEGKIPILFREAEEAVALASRLRPQVEAWTGPLLNAQREVTVLWEEKGEVPLPPGFGERCFECGQIAPNNSPGHCRTCDLLVSGGFVRCRARMDLWVPDHPAGPTIFDLKIVESAGEAFERSMTAHGLDIQAAVYPRAMERVHPELAGRINFVFLLCRKDGRYVVPVTPSRSALALGVSRWERAVARWAGALASGDWPGPAPRVLEIKPWQHEAEALANGLYQVEGDGDA